MRELNGLVEHLGPQWVPAKRLLAVRTDPLHWSVCKTVAMVDCSVFPVLFGTVDARMLAEVPGLAVVFFSFPDNQAPSVLTGR